MFDGRLLSSWTRRERTPHLKESHWLRCDWRQTEERQSMAWLVVLCWPIYIYITEKFNWKYFPLMCHFPTKTGVYMMIKCILKKKSIRCVAQSLTELTGILIELLSQKKYRVECVEHRLISYIIPISFSTVLCLCRILEFKGTHVWHGHWLRKLSNSTFQSPSHVKTLKQSVSLRSLHSSRACRQ